MAYDRLIKFAQAIDEIKDQDDLVFIEDVCVNLAISKPTFYDWWPTHSEEYAEIFQGLERNKIQLKRKIRQQLSKSDKAGELLALYKLIGTREDREKLSTHRIDHGIIGDQIPEEKTIDLKKLSDETLEELFKSGFDPEQT